MKELNERQARFVKKWEKKRKNKWKFIFLNGSLAWGLPVAVIGYLWQIGFHFSAFKWAQFTIMVLFFLIAGLGFGYWLFWRTDKLYKQYTDTED